MGSERWAWGHRSPESSDHLQWGTNLVSLGYVVAVDMQEPLGAPIEDIEGILEFATFNNLVLTNTLGLHKPSRRWTWHSPDGKHHNQIDYILVKKRFRSGVNIHRTRSFPGADIESDHDLVMMTFQVRLKMARKPNQPRLRFDHDKLRNKDVACTFQATIGGKFEVLTKSGMGSSRMFCTT